MSFLKRIFSIGSKKNKKQRAPIVQNVDARVRNIAQEEEHEAALNRLLRSSSTRYTVVSEAEYSSLPPLPHPINQVIQPPTASTDSLASSTLSRRGTYSVTIHKRKQLTPTDSCDVNNDGATSNTATSDRCQSNDMAQLLELRSHPSVASLLEMYDDQGRIPVQAFSNSPKKERAQTQRSGSTLRELLGQVNDSHVLKNHSESAEGDISWAERFLGEINSFSSATSTIDLRTPPIGSTGPHEICDHSSFATHHDLSTNGFENPAISSLEVELSVTEPVEPKTTGPYTNTGPMTPRRASQVFKFLTEQRPSSCNDEQARSLPELPSTFSISSDEESNETRSHFSNDSLDDSIISAVCPAISEPDTNNTNHTPSAMYPIQPSDGPHMSSHHNSISSHNKKPTNAAETLWEATNFRKIENLPNAPSKVILTAPTPSGKLGAPSRIPRGSGAPLKRLSNSNNKVRRSFTSTERPLHISNSRSGDRFTPAFPKHKSQGRKSSGSSTSLRNMEIGAPTRLMERGTRTKGVSTWSTMTGLNKENSAELTVNPILPSTPLRSKSDSKSLFRAAVTPFTFRPPHDMASSPASSSDLSPVGKQLMMNVRQQRSRAREAERYKNRAKFGHMTSKI